MTERSTNKQKKNRNRVPEYVEESRPLTSVPVIYQETLRKKRVEMDK
jgi:hypothetical protein